MISKFLFLLPLLFSSLSCFAQQWKAWNNEGIEFFKQGKYQQAIERYTQALHSPEDSVDEASILTNMGYCYQALANYSEAQRVFRQSLRLTLSQLPPLHVHQIETVIDLANAFLPGGQYDSCEYYLYQADRWLKESVTLKNDHYQQEIYRFFDVSIHLLNSSASLAYKKGQWDKAAILMEQQRQYIKDVYPDNFQTLSIYHSTLNNLSAYYTEGGNFIKAKPVAQEQVSLSASEKNSLPYLQALNNLASVYRQLEEYDSAIFLYTPLATALDTGSYHGSDLHIAVINNLGELHYSLENYPVAIRYLSESISLQEKRPAVNPRIYQATLLALSEALHWSGDFLLAEKTYKKLTSSLTDEILHSYTYLSDAEKISFFRNNVSALESFSSFAFELQGDLKLLKEPVNFTSRSGLNDLFDLLMVTKGLILHPGLRMKNAILTGSNPEIKAKYEQWEDKKYSYATEVRKEDANARTIATLAFEIEELEKWLRIHSHAFQKGFVKETKSWRDVQQALKPKEAAVEVVRLYDGLVYGVLVLTAQSTGGPVATLVKSKYPLFLEKQFYKNYANSIQYELVDTTSYKTFWKPIADAIADATGGKAIQRVYFSPDGIYNKINLNTLYDPESKNYLIHQNEIIYVTNMKEILTGKDKSNPTNKKAVLFGRPDFYSSANEKVMDITDLPGTEIEVEKIDSMLKKNGWQSTLFKRDEATETTAKQLQSPAILHFATHGFVVQDTSRNDLAGVMLNAGIILAHAGSKSTTGDDGVLTAYEMMNVNLDHTQLTILSACETGLGGYYQGEGVYGLQCAIRSAGSGATIMSLWKVDDKATQQLMTAFYSNWLSKKFSAREAFRLAQLNLMKTYPQPRYWGAFVFGGK